MIYKKEISKEELALLPHGKYQGEIELITDKHKANKALEDLMQCNIIGMDTEARPAFRKGQSFPVSLVQLASDKKVYLFRTLQTGKLTLLEELLKDSNITKVGIAVHDDLKDISRRLAYTAQNVIDLNILAQEKGFKNIGARKLSALILNIRISKAQQVSNWENRILTKAQIDYAATDAWLCREIYLRLTHSHS
jgi:ribonuclease D